MTKRFLLILWLAVLALSACTNENSIVTLGSLLSVNGGKWKVSFAKFGDEEAARGMYDRFLIEFKSNGAYLTTNPDGAISPALLPAGAWKEENGKLLFDGQITVRELSQQRTANKLILEWDVTIPGKVTTTYRIELIKSN